MSEEKRSRRGAQGAGPTARQQYWMEFYKKYHEEVACYFARHVRCPQDVEDLVQMVFLRLMGHRGDLRNPRGYLHIVARHQLYAHWRRKKTSLPAASMVSVPAIVLLTGLRTDGGVQSGPTPPRRLVRARACRVGGQVSSGFMGRPLLSMRAWVIVMASSLLTSSRIVAL
jgi:DNA-directed RNA polymerase specialized sigma24 family protein